MYFFIFLFFVIPCLVIFFCSCSRALFLWVSRSPWFQRAFLWISRSPWFQWDFSLWFQGVHTSIGRFLWVSRSQCSKGRFLWVSRSSYFQRALSLGFKESMVPKGFSLLNLVTLKIYSSYQHTRRFFKYQKFFDMEK